MAKLTGRAWEVIVTPGTPLLTANQRWGHWGPVHSRTMRLQDIAKWAAVAQHIPHIEMAHITLMVVVPDRRKRDPANWAPTGKALVDGLVKIGVLDDDDFAHVKGPYPDLEIQRGCKLHVRLIIREMQGEYIP